MLDSLSLIPQDLEAEDDVLGAALVGGAAAMNLLRSELDVEAFYLSWNQKIYRTCLDLHAKDTPIDPMTIVRLLSDRDQLEQIGGQSKIADLMDRGYLATVNLPVHVARVRDRYLQRLMWFASQEIAKLATKPTDDIDETLNQAQAKLFAIHQLANKKKAKTEHLSDILLRVRENLEASNTGEDAAFTFIPTGIKSLDEKIGGLRLNYVSVVAARPGMGKTTFATEVGLRAALGGVNVMFFSIEMTKEDIGTKILARLSSPDVEMSAFLGRNAMPERGWQYADTALGLASDLGFWVNDSGRVTPLDVRTALRESAVRGEEVGLVIIDYLQMMKATNPTNREVEDIDQILKELKEIAKEFNIAILGLAQLNRNVESRPNKRPVMSDLRSSGAIEQEAAAIFGLYNDSYYNPDTPDRGISEVSILKARFGVGGETVRLFFEPEYGRFRDIPAPNAKPIRGNDLIAEYGDTWKPKTKPAPPPDPRQEEIDRRLAEVLGELEDNDPR